MTTETEAIRPFSTGTQFMDWEATNCSRCTKAGDEPDGYTYSCPIRQAIAWAAIDEGVVAPDIAQRMGLLENQESYVWFCGEFDPTPEAIQKAEQDAKDRASGMDVLYQVASLIRSVGARVRDMQVFLKDRGEAMLEEGASQLGPNDDPWDALTDGELHSAWMDADDAMRSLKQLEPLFQALKAKLEGTAQP